MCCFGYVYAFVCHQNSFWGLTGEHTETFENHVMEFKVQVTISQFQGSKSAILQPEKQRNLNVFSSARCFCHVFAAVFLANCYTRSTTLHIYINIYTYIHIIIYIYLYIYICIYIYVFVHYTIYRFYIHTLYTDTHPYLCTCNPRKCCSSIPVAKDTEPWIQLIILAYRMPTK